MGISSKKQKSTQTTNQNTSMTTTPTNPEWVTGGLGDLGSRISSTFKNLDPYSLVAGADPLQTQAAAGAAQLGQFAPYGGGGGQMGMSNPVFFSGAGGPPTKAQTLAARSGGAPSSGDPYADAMSTFNGMRGSKANTYNPTQGQAVTGQAVTGQSASLLDNLQAYMDPFIDRVVDTSLAGFDRDRNLTRQQQMLDLGADETFGGSGGSILRALTEGELGLSRGQLESGLRSDAFNTGAALSGQDADRRQQMGLANMQAQNTFGLANMDAQNQFGLANMDALNTAGQFNAGQRDTALNRQLAGAQGLVTSANSQQEQQRANIESQSGMGEILRQIQQQRAMAPVAALGMESSLWGGLPLDLLKGSTATGSLSGTSTGTQKSSGLGNILDMFSGAWSPKDGFSFGFGG